VVDDGSPDHTAQVVRRHPGVRYIRQSNQGVSAARNKGLQESKGDYIVFLDADDRLLPNHLWTGLTAFRQNPKAALVCGSFVSFSDHSGSSTHQFDPTDHYASVLRFPSIAMVLTAMFKRDILKELGGVR
jgi:glycosyltransferase involved in cell wall biosynthesis